MFMNGCCNYPELVIFVSCVMVCNVIRFDLRVFSGFLSGFYLFALQLIHFSKIRGLEWLKMRFWIFKLNISK